MNELTILMLGDVTGEAGLSALEEMLGGLKTEFGASLTVVNGENAAAGFGLGAYEAQRIFAAGADVITSGNHVWEKREFLEVLEADRRVLRPANYPDAAGRGIFSVEKDGARWAVVNLQGREFMQAIDCPFRMFDKLYAGPENEGAIFIVDFHAESGKEKEALAFYADGRAAVLAGTHTHIQTSDQRLLPAGTAYISDLGMTGAFDGIIGMKTEICLERARKQVLYKLECATERRIVQGIAVKIDGSSGKPLSIERFSRFAPVAMPNTGSH
jgi:metallophosphoesterase (TIGR00282 family)